MPGRSKDRSEPGSGKKVGARTVRGRARTGGKVRGATGHAKLRPRRPGPAPAREPRDDQRLLIERIAEELFAQNGYRGASVRQIAARADCSPGQLYNLYADKGALFRAVLDKKVARIAEVTRSATSSGEAPWLRCERLVREVLEFFQENSHFFRMFEVEAGLDRCHSPRATIDFARGPRREWLNLITGLLAEWREEGGMHADVDPRSAAVSLEGLIKGHTMDWTLGGGEGPLVDRADAILELFKRGVQSRGRRT